MSKHVKGVINVRGKVISVIDLRLRFGMQEIEYTPRTCIIVAGASEVLTLEAAGIEDSPDSGTVKILLDLNKVVQE